MSEQEQLSLEVSAEGQQTQETAKDEKPIAESGKPKPAGYDPVDVKTASPEEIEARIRYLYDQVKEKKDSSKKIKELESNLREYRTVAKEQSQILAQIMENQNRLGSHLQKQDLDKTEKQIHQELKEAYDKGDIEAFAKANQRLAALQAEQTAQKILQTHQQQAPVNQQRMNGFDPYQAAQMAKNSSALSDDEAMAVKAWQEERDANGNLLRPWAFPSEDADLSQKHKMAWSIAKGVFGGGNTNNTVAEKLAKIDEFMGVKKPVPQAVMSGNLTQGKKVSSVSMSDAQKQMAIRLRAGGLKAKSDADHIAAFRAQLEKAAKGARA